MTTTIDLDALLSHSAGACDALARRYAATLARMADITRRDGASYGQLLDSASLDWHALHPLARLVADKTDRDEHRVMTYLATCQKLMILQHRDGSLANAQGLMDCKAALADAGGTGWATGMDAALADAERRLGLAGDHIEGVWSIVHGSVVVDRPACPTATMVRCVALPVCGACDGSMTASCLYAGMLTMLPGSAKLRFVPGCQCCGGTHA